MGDQTSRSSQDEAWADPSSALLAALFLFLALPVAAQTEPPEILILHSYHMGQVWTDGVMAGMQEVFDPLGEDLRLQVEYMDTKRHHDPAYLTELLDLLLTYKLQRLHFDLLLLSDNDALNFALRHRDDLFANTPIIFCGINNFQPEMIAGIADITGVAEYPNFSETIGLALRFHPQARKMVVIGNTRNETDRQNYRLFLQAVPEFSDRLAFEHWDDLPMHELADHLAALEPNTLVCQTDPRPRQAAALSLPPIEGLKASVASRIRWLLSTKGRVRPAASVIRPLMKTVRRIARRCGGRVWVEETPGGGSTFWLELETAGCFMPEEAS